MTSHITDRDIEGKNIKMIDKVLQTKQELIDYWLNKRPSLDEIYDDTHNPDEELQHVHTMCEEKAVELRLEMLQEVDPDPSRDEFLGCDGVRVFYKTTEGYIWSVCNEHSSVSCDGWSADWAHFTCGPSLFRYHGLEVQRNLTIPLDTSDLI